MARVRLALTAIAFFLDCIAAIYVLSASGEQKGLADVLLMLGRLLGLNVLAVLGVHLAGGKLPCISRMKPAGASEARSIPLLERDMENGPVCQPCGGLNLEASQSSGGAGSAQTDQSSGDSRSAQIDSTVSEQQQLLKKQEKGLIVRNTLLVVGYFYIAVCSMWTAITVVSSNFEDAGMQSTSLWCSIARMISLFAMNMEFYQIKRLVIDATAGTPVTLVGVHEHPLFWKDTGGKGYSMCNLCREKIGEKTGGYMALQCRVCEPNRWGWGGFTICLQCYRKNAAKDLEKKNAGAAGAGILIGDKGPKPAQPLTALQYVVRVLQMARKCNAVAAFASVCMAQIVNAYIPKAQGDVIGALVKDSANHFQQKVVVFVALTIASAVLSYIKSVAVSTLQARLRTDMSVRLFRSLLSQDIAFYDNAMTGQLSSRLSNDLGQAVSPVSIIINSFVGNIIMLFAGFGICLSASWRLTLLAFTFIAPVMYISEEFSKWASTLMATQFSYMADASGAATQAFTNIRTVRSFGAKELEQEKYEGHMVKSMDIGLKNAWGNGFANLLSGLVEQSASLIILYYGGHLALDHDGFDVGDIITFTYLWNRLSSAFSGLNDNLNQPIKAMSAGQRVFEVLDLKPDISEETGLTTFPQSSDEDTTNGSSNSDWSVELRRTRSVQHVKIELENVDFTYQSRPDKQVLKQVSLTIAAGQTTAFVGKSGCGKSTLSKLILRSYDPRGGSIKINGVELQDLHLPTYRKRVGIVSQDTQLFRSTVCDNITYGLRPGSFSQEDIERAAKLANAHDFIQELPEGYKTLCGEGGHDLSGGQKQRISIARALVRRPQLLLLDEATSALDAENEAVVQEALDSLMQEMSGSCTIMVIAHRLSTIKDANRIIVLQEGSVVEQGTHEELLKKNGQYHALVQRQLDPGGSAAGAEDDGEDSPDKKAKDVESQVVKLIESLPDDMRGQVLMSLMTSFKKSFKGGKGGGKS